MEGYPAAPSLPPLCHLPCVSSPQVPLEDHVIYSGNLFQYIEENKKWRNRFCVVPHNYGLVLYENKLVRGITLSPVSGGHSFKAGTPHRCGGMAMLPVIHDHLFLLRPMSGTCLPVYWSTVLATRSSPPWTSTWSW